MGFEDNPLQSTKYRSPLSPSQRCSQDRAVKWDTDVALCMMWMKKAKLVSYPTGGLHWVLPSREKFFLLLMPKAKNETGCRSLDVLAQVGSGWRAAPGIREL